MRHIVIVVFLVALATAVVAVGLGQIGLLPAQASQEGVLVDRLFEMEILVIAFLFALIMVFMIYSVVVFRRKPGETGDGAYVTGNKKLEIAWTLIPLGVVLFFATLGTQYLGDITAPGSNELVVKVTASQWAWRFEYPEYGIASTELNLPKDRRVRFELFSTDVIHSFWVPEFRLKQDAVPGMTTTLRITPTKTGQYTLRCAEMCGRAHAYMNAPVKVMAPADFDAWVASQKAPLTPLERGAQLAKTQGCLACHSVDGSRLVGPSWQGLYGSSVTLADGTTVKADDDYLRESIVKPDVKIVNGFSPRVMPSSYAAALKEDDVAALITYIKSLSQ